MSCRTNYNNSFVNIRTSVDRGPVQSMYNYRLTPLDTHDLEEQLRNVFDGQTYSFKINISYGFILRNKQMGRYIYFHSSYNFCGRFLDEPSLVTNLRYFEIFLQQTTRRLPSICSTTCRPTLMLRSSTRKTNTYITYSRIRSWADQ